MTNYENAVVARDLEALTGYELEIVRCRECKHWYENRGAPSYCRHRHYTGDGGLGSIYGSHVQPDFFCAAGEREES